MLRHTIRRFIADRVTPFADAWEEQGFVPREVLREMGALGSSRLRYAPEPRRRRARCARHGRAGRGARPLDLRRLRHHRAGAYRHGEPAPRSLRHARAARAVPAGHHGRPQDHRGRPSPSPTPAPTSPPSAPRAAQGRRRLCAERHQDVHHQRRARRPLLRRRQDRAEAGRNRRITMFIVEKGTPGFRVGRALDKNGWLSSDTAELVFEDCRVPAENVLGRGGPAASTR